MHSLSILRKAQIVKLSQICQFKTFNAPPLGDGWLAGMYWKLHLIRSCIELVRSPLVNPSILEHVKKKNMARHSKIVSEYDQEIPQSQTADNPVAPRGRAAQPSHQIPAFVPTHNLAQSIFCICTIYFSMQTTGLILTL